MTTIRLRRDTTTRWETHNPVLDPGEKAVDTTTGYEYTGDGVTEWLDLVPTSIPFATRGGRLSTAVGEASRPYIDVADYGLNRAGIEAAFDALSATDRQTLVVPPGGYDLGSTTLDLSGKAFDLVAEGAIFESSASQILQVGGSVASAAAELTGDADMGDTSITVDSTTGFAAGDLIRIWSDGEVYNDDRPSTHFKGELAEVLAVASGTELTLTAGLDDSYDATGNTVSVDLISPLSGSIGGLEIVGAGSSQRGLFVTAFRGWSLQAVRAIDVDLVGVQMTCGLDASISDSYASGSNDSSIGYGFQVGDCSDISISNTHGRGNRHSFDISTSTGPARAPSRRITYTACTASADISAGFSSHGDSDSVTWSDCWAYWCAGGFVARGSKQRIKGGGVRGTKTGGYTHGITLGDDTPNDKGNGRAGKGLLIDGVDFDLRGHGIAGSVYGLYCTAATENALVRDTVFRGHSSYGQFWTGDTHRNLRIVGGHVDSSLATVANSYCIFQNHADTSVGNNTIGLTIAGVKITGDGNTNATFGIRLNGHTDNTAPSDNITIVGNDIQSVGQGVNFASGYWGRGAVENNYFESISTVPYAYTTANWTRNPLIRGNRYGASVAGVQVARGPVTESRTAAPTTGTWERGDIVWNALPSAGGVPGWVCTSGGTPGTWTPLASAHTVQTGWTGASNLTTDRAYDADTVVITELADVVGTLIADLKAAGIISA